MWNGSRDRRVVPIPRDTPHPVDLGRGTGASGVRAADRGRSRPVVLAVVAGLGAVMGSGAVRSATPSPEPPIAGEGVDAAYLRALHDHIHPLWTALYVRGVADKLPPGHPAANRDRQAVVLFSVRWDGSAADVSVVRESGVAAFDQAARAAIVRVERFPVPPVSALSDDGLAHFRWVFARDERLCSGGELLRFEDSLEDAVPQLLIEGRVEEALWRVARRAATPEASRDSEDPLALFAREWLSRPQPDPVSDGQAAAALARVGDDRQIPRLRAALQRHETAATAAVALRSLRVELCPLVLDGLGARDPRARETALLALGAGGGRLPPGSPCVQVLSAIVSDRSQDGKQRALAAQALAAISADGARRVLALMLTDEETPVRAAAVSLLARPGGGRPALYRWVPFLHDPAIEVRTAAAVTLIRSCGDLALDQLVLVWKESDPRVAVAVAQELGHLGSSNAESFLLRLAKRRDPEVQTAAADALAARRALAAHTPPRGKTSAPVAVTVTAPAPPSSMPTPMSTSASAAVREVSGLGRREAADWVLTHFYRLDHADLIDVFGAWLAGAAPRATAPVSAR
jgi:TonB family protein